MTEDDGKDRSGDQGERQKRKELRNPSAKSVDCGIEPRGDVGGFGHLVFDSNDAIDACGEGAKFCRLKRRICRAAQRDNAVIDGDGNIFVVPKLAQNAAQPCGDIGVLLGAVHRGDGTIGLLCDRWQTRIGCALASASNAINCVTRSPIWVSGIMLGPSDGAVSGASWVSIKTAAMPRDTAARAITGANSR